MTTKTMKKLNEITGSKLTLGKAIRSIRLSEGFKQGEFANKLKVSQSYLSDIENNRKEVSPQKAAELAKILQQSEKQFIRLAIQDTLERYGFHYAINVRDAA